MGDVFPNIGEGCSKEVREGSASKKSRERLARVGHLHDKVSPTHFAKVILAARLDLLTLAPSQEPSL
jgi:hypothetical protein